MIVPVVRTGQRRLRRAIAAAVGAAFLALAAPCGLLADSFVYVSNDGSANVSGYRLDETTGALTPVPGSPVPAGGGPLSVVIDPTGRFVYTSNRITDNVSAFRVNAATGA